MNIQRTRTILQLGNLNLDRLDRHPWVLDLVKSQMLPQDIVQDRVQKLIAVLGKRQVLVERPLEVPHDRELLCAEERLEHHPDCHVDIV